MRLNLSSNEKAEDLLKTLISVRSDTGADMNPVMDCASEMLEERGFNVMRYSFSPGTPCIVARYAASEDIGLSQKKELILHCHLDTASFDDYEWRMNPLGGEEINGRIFGRGALDCKGLAAVWIHLIGKFKAQACKLPFDVVFVAVSDEECDGINGTEALLEATTECNDAFLVIGEGGGYPLRTVSGIYVTLQTGEMEKVAAQSTRRPRRATAGIKNLARHTMRGTFSRETLRYLIESSFAREGVRRLLASPFEMEYMDGSNLHRLPADSPGVPGFVLDAARSALRKVNRNMRILPIATRGHSDNRHFRRRGIPTIGFFPLSESNSLNGYHAANEYVTLDSLRFAEEVLKSTIMNCREAIRG